MRRKRKTSSFKRTAISVADSRIYILLLLLLILIASFLTSPVGDYWLFRTLRVVIVGASLVYYFIYGKREINIILALFFFTLSNLSIIWYENLFYGQIALILGSIGFIFFIVELIRNIKFKSISKIFYTFLIVCGIVYARLLVEFIDMLHEYIKNETIHQLVILNTSLSFVVGILVFCYNHVSNTKKSLLFTFFYLFLVFSEVFRAIGYYGFVDEYQGQYMARGLYVLSFVFFIFYGNRNVLDDIPLNKINAGGRI